jgi:hypothetical protein
MRRPNNSEFAEYYSGYVSTIPETDVLAVLKSQPTELFALIGPVPEDKGSWAYADGKWTLKELLGHVIDAERVFGYRLHRFSHADETPLSSFEQDGYVANGRSNERSFEDLLDEFAAQRSANIALIRSLRDSDWDLKGVASGASVTVRALAFIMAGHVRHHSNIIRERYLT